MFSLLLAAAGLTPAVNDATYVELGHVNRTSGECTARFDGGAIEIRQAYDKAAGTMINVVVISGRPTGALSAGQTLWVHAGFGPAWHALVTQASAQRVEIVANSRFVGELLAADSPPIMLYQRLDSKPSDAVQVSFGYTSDLCQKLATVLDCAEGLGI